MLSNDDIFAEIKKTFYPLQSRAEMQDYGTKLRIRVYDRRNERVIDMITITIKEAQDESQLQQILKKMKHRARVKMSAHGDL